MDRDGDGIKIGRRLLCQSGRLFEHKYKVDGGTILRSAFLQNVSRLRPMVRSDLEQRVPARSGR